VPTLIVAGQTVEANVPFGQQSSAAEIGPLAIVGEVYIPDALPVTQPTESKHCMNIIHTTTYSSK